MKFIINVLNFLKNIITVININTYIIFSTLIESFIFGTSVNTNSVSSTGATYTEAFTEAIYNNYYTLPYTLEHRVFKTDKTYGEPSE